MNPFCLAGSLFLLVLTAFSRTSAAAIYDNGPPNKKDGYEMTHWIQADDFTLTSAARLDSVKLWTLEGSGSFTGTFFWQIYSNDETNGPGTVLFSGTSANLSHVATGFSLFGYPEYVVTFDLTSVALPAGVYWLALHNGPFSNNSDTGRVFWETTDNLGSRPSHTILAPFSGQWYGHIPGSSSSEQAFMINGVPAPAVNKLAVDGGVRQITFTTIAGQTYRLDYKENPNDVSWSSLPGEVVGNGNAIDWSDTDPSEHRIYRVRLCPCGTFQPPTLQGFSFTSQPQISFATVIGQTYRVEYKDDVWNPIWTPLLGAEAIAGTGAIMQIADRDPNVRSNSHRFYRAILLQ